MTPAACDPATGSLYILALCLCAALEDYAALWPPCTRKIKLDALKSKPVFGQCQLAESIAAAVLASPRRGGPLPILVSCTPGGRSRGFSNVHWVPVDPKPTLLVLQHPDVSAHFIEGYKKSFYILAS